MQRAYEAHYHAVEARHWWFRARREIVARLVTQLAPTCEAHILDIGCSSGLLLDELRRRGYRHAQGIDASEEGVALCCQRGLGARVMDAHTPGFPAETFDVLCASDVLEHLEYDARALESWWQLLRPGGWLILFVPAHAWLWTRHDEANRHFRRYTRPQVVQLLAGAGFEVRRSSYWNSALFPPVALVRVWRRRRSRPGDAAGSDASDMFLPPAPINVLLRGWLAFENTLHSLGLNSPMGISVMALARKPGQRHCRSPRDEV